MKIVPYGTILDDYQQATKEQVLNNRDWLVDNMGNWDVISFATGTVSSSKHCLLSSKKTDCVLD